MDYQYQDDAGAKMTEDAEKPIQRVGKYLNYGRMNLFLKSKKRLVMGVFSCALFVALTLVPATEASAGCHEGTRMLILVRCIDENGTHYSNGNGCFVGSSDCCTNPCPGGNYEM